MALVAGSTAAGLTVRIVGSTGIRLHCPDALYFDGVVSRLWDPAAGREDQGKPLGPIVVALQTR